MVKRCVKLLEKPTAGLKSKDASDRLLTASLLINRYRTAPPPSFARCSSAISAATAIDRSSTLRASRIGCS